MIRTIRNYLKNISGLATIEAALLLPILATLSLAAADAGMMMMTIHRLETGLAAGGAYLSRTYVTIEDEAAAKQVAVTGHAVAGYQAVVKDWSTSDVTVTVGEIDNSGANGELVLRAGNKVRIARLQTSYAYTGLGFLQMVKAGNITLTAKHEERITTGSSL